MTETFWDNPERADAHPLAKPVEPWTLALPVPLVLMLVPALVGRIWGLAVDHSLTGVTVSFWATVAMPLPCGAATYLLARRRGVRRDLAIGLAFTAGAIGLVSAVAGFILLELAWPNPFWETD